MHLRRSLLAAVLLLSTLTLGCATAPPAALPSAPIAAALQLFVDHHVLAGAVTLIATKDQVLDVETVGYADIAAGKPMRPDTLFWIASMTKPFTATAVMMLVDEGKVKLDDPIEKYLPEFKGQMVAVEADKEHVLLKPAAHPITVREVLSHTSGLPFLPRITGKIDQYPLSALVLAGAMSPLQSQPGTKYAYSNTGIDTAGRVVEVASGMKYEDLMQRRLFDPLGMKDTTFWPTPAQLQRLAKTYKAGPGNQGLEETTSGFLTYPLDNHQRIAEPGGGLFSTAADVTRFGQMILSGGVFAGRRYLSAAAVQEMTSTQTANLPGRPANATEDGYGLGWNTSRVLRGSPAPAPGSGGPFGHGGALGTDLRLDPEHGLVVVYLIQHTGAPPSPDGKKPAAVFADAVRAAFVK